jgi:c(7)-type cytochrome triheme protein
MKFDHAAHARGEAEPRDGCNHCHDPRGPGKSIPAGIDAHANCFSCHTPDKDIGKCNTCHELAPYSRTPQSRYVFRAVFSHADHGPGQGVSCAECHSVRSGGQGRQVTNLAAREHTGPGNNCADCHNGSRAFGGNGPNDFANCRRCHTGSGFDSLPGQ